MKCFCSDGQPYSFDLPTGRQVWQPLPGQTLSSIQLSFMKFTAQQIKFALAVDNPGLLAKCKVNKSDRLYQIWKRKPLSIELSSEKVFIQNLPAGRQDWNTFIVFQLPPACAFIPKIIIFPSASFYENGIDHFKMLTHYMG